MPPVNCISQPGRKAVPGDFFSGAVSLGIQVHHQDLFSRLRDGGGKIDGCGGLAHTALLIRDRDDLRHIALPFMMSSGQLYASGASPFSILSIISTRR